MSLFMILRIGLKALSRNKMRTSLTMLGLIIGVAAVITMVALGSGAQQAIEDQITSAGTNMISVPYGVYGGVLSFETEATEALLAEAKSAGMRGKVTYIELRARTNEIDGLPESDLYVTYRQDLPDDPNLVMPALPKRARAEVRKAADRFDLKCEESDDLASFYRLFGHNKRRLGSPSLPFKWFKGLREEFGSRVVLHIVREPNGTPIASVRLSR